MSYTTDCVISQFWHYNHRGKLLIANCFTFCNRYHYNVADARLAQHVERGNEDGLLISCVASCSNLWALIMDAGTGFTSQVYELTATFLHKVWSPSIWLFIFSFWRTRIFSPPRSFFFRSGLWSSGRRTTTLALLLVPTMEALLWWCQKVSYIPQTIIFSHTWALLHVDCFQVVLCYDLNGSIPIAILMPVDQGLLYCTFVIPLANEWKGFYKYTRVNLKITCITHITCKHAICILFSSWVGTNLGKLDQ